MLTKSKVIHCFDCKKALRPFAFKNCAILRCVNYGGGVKLEMTYIGKVS